MKIDRHNYEEYFLLYIDNELAVEQKKQVDLFVKENPDLGEELVMLQQSKLVPDNSVVFDKKDLLIKEDKGSFIHLDNYEEWLVLYADNELNEEEKGIVEKFAATHPHIQEELDLFLKTKLQPETIVFDNKKVLYRKERTAVISMQWWRVAVAAILIVAAGVIFYSILYNKNNSGRTSAKIAGTKSGVTTDTIRTITPNKQEQNTAEKRLPDNIIKNGERMPVATSTVKEFNKEKKQKERKIQRGGQQKNPQLAVNNNGVNNETQTGQLATNEINNKKIEQAQINNDIVNGNKTHKEIFENTTVTNPVVQTPDNSNASGNGVEYASNTENKRFRGFFRKAARIIERTTNINPANDDNKVLIGGVAINLK